ncbi:13568_t:CDS:2, partial [Cetraspora pellucida]
STKKFLSMVLQFCNSKTLSKHLKEDLNQNWHYKIKMAKDIANSLQEPAITITDENIAYANPKCSEKDKEKLQVEILRGVRETHVNRTPIDYIELYYIDIDHIYQDHDYIPKIFLEKKNPSVSNKDACLMVIKSSLQNQYLFLPVEGEIFIKRNKSNNIIIKDQEIARRHAKIICSQGKVDIISLSSQSRIIFNSEKLFYCNSRTLKRNDIIEIGCSIFQYLLVGEYENCIDKLLPIYNNAYLLKSLKTEFISVKKNKQNLSLIFFDLDHFKSINDDNDYGTGNYALKELATLIKNNHVKAEDIFA